MTESLLLCGIDPPWDLSFGWSQIEAVIELLFLFSGRPTSNHTRVQMRGDQVCDAKFKNKQIESAKWRVGFGDLVLSCVRPYVRLCCNNFVLTRSRLHILNSYVESYYFG